MQVATSGPKGVAGRGAGDDGLARRGTGFRTPAILHRGALGLALAVLASCGRAAEPEQGPAPHFPVRQLLAGDRHPTDGRVVLEDGCDALDGWWLLGATAEHSFTLVPARESPGVRVRDGHAILQPDCALVRLVGLPETARYTLTALLWPATPAPAKSPCPNLIMASMHNLKDQAFADGAFSEPRAAPALASLLADIASHPTAAWREDAGTGFTEARAYTEVGVAPGDTAGFLVILAAWGQPLLIDNVSLVSTPTLRHGFDPSTELPPESDTVSISGLKISGQFRVSARVPPGQVLSMPISVPEGAVDMALGTSPDPDPALAPGTPTGWRLVVQPGNHVVAQFEERTPEQGRAPQFTDRLLAWPAGVHGPVVVEFSVTGQAAMVFGQPKVRGPEQPQAPSLLLISIDTLRADHLGFMGYDRPTSPFLDAFAQRSVVFTDVTAVASYTLPTHASMFTGLFPPRHLAIDTLDRLDAERTPTLAAILSDAGFHTAGFTGGGFVSVDFGFAAGFDRYSTVDPVVLPSNVAPDSSGAWPDEERIAQARDSDGLLGVSRWIERQGRRPWMAFLHTFAVHEYEPPFEDRQLFVRPNGIPPDFDVQQCLNTRNAGNPPTAAERERLLDLYDATIHDVDRRLGDLLGMLGDLGLLQNTIVVVTSDHGEEFFEHGHLRHHGTLYQDLLHVPLLIHMPGATTGLRIDEPVSQVDLLPTLLELLGQGVPAGLDGRSLADFVRGGRPSTPATPLFAHIDRYLHGRTSLRDGPLKLIHSDSSATRQEPATIEWELFDLAQDPGETANLAAERGADVELLRQRLAALHEVLRAGGAQRQSITLNDELREQLVGLGYVEASR